MFKSVNEAFSKQTIYLDYHGERTLVKIVAGKNIFIATIIKLVTCIISGFSLEPFLEMSQLALSLEWRYVVRRFWDGLLVLA